MAICRLSSSYGSSSFKFDSGSISKVGIIGTAGRKGTDRNKLTKELYDKAIDKAKEIIEKDFKLSLNSVHLVSGGAAWADHIAVALFILGEVPDLTLHFPTKFQLEKPQFLDSGVKNYKKNPGRTANQYHLEFSKKIKDSSLKQIESAIHMGAQYKEHSGFHERNTFVAKESNYLIAFTCSDSGTPVEGSGTFDTWKKCKSDKKVHVCLKSLLSSDIKKTKGEKEGEGEGKRQGKGELGREGIVGEENRDTSIMCQSQTRKRKSDHVEEELIVTSCKKHKIYS